MPYHSSKSFMALAQLVSDQLADIQALPLVRHPVKPNGDEPDLKLMEHFQVRGSTAEEALKLMQD